MLFVPIIFCLVAGSTALVVEPGHCPDVTVNKMNLTKLSGVWYKYASNENELDEEQKNIKIDMTPPENGVSIATLTSFSKLIGDSIKTVCKVTLTENDEVFKAIFSVPILGKLERTFWNIALDNNAYVVSLACENLGPNHIKGVALYTRERNPPKDVLLAAQKETEKNGVAWSNLIKLN
ncbi:hypothetical protein KQX54_018646 [Cotesia glomerata]|uniref:Lipocalin/cytosolic fatty-acid binding domain-containing protein n=1 Tax=Cotesia glomerata TaxID=32391 RepID=A0AAV7IIQ3_COTGL|nr:hypothetical protein KQX54_018646 [Cotesia glomerata]